jgi:cytochrome c oxidase subunit 3
VIDAPHDPDVSPRRSGPEPGNAFDRMPAGRLGMTLFLATLAVLFASSMVGYAIVAWKLGADRTFTDPYAPGGEVVAQPIDLPPLPWLLAVSTLMIVVSSATIQYAKSSIRAGRVGGLKTGLSLTLVLGLLFMALQAVCWAQWWEAAVRPLLEQAGDEPSGGDASARAARFAVAGFLVLSALHAAHVLGGMAPLVVALARAATGRYSASRWTGIGHLAAYWHFLDIVWIVLYAALLIGS